MTFFADATHGGGIALGEVGSGGMSTIGTVAAGVPYFIVAWGADFSYYGAHDTNVLIRRLDTGVVSEYNGSPTGAGSSDGTYSIGMAYNQVTGKQDLAAVMYAPSSIGWFQARRWAADPWAFWYPKASRNYIVGVGFVEIQVTYTNALYFHARHTKARYFSVTTVAVVFLAAWANPSNRPVLGTGFY
jgi:hypothetical protein